MSGLRVTVLISGNGSNLQALIDARTKGRLPIQIVRVISNQEDAFGLQRAEEAGIPTRVIDHTRYASRSEFDTVLASKILEDRPDLVVLAGFMRIIGSEVLEPLQGCMINLHPSLLPLYRGTNTYQRALDAGDSEHGASIHFVSEVLDGGPVVAQARIPILDSDDAETLAARLGPVEHRLLVATVEFLASHDVAWRDDTIQVDGIPQTKPLQLQTDGSLG